MAGAVGKYDVHGLHLNVEAETISLLKCAEEALGPFSTGRLEGDVYELRIDHRPAPDANAPPPEGMRLEWQGKLPNGLEVAHFSGDGVEQTNLPGLAMVRTHRPRRLVCVSVARGEEWCVSRGCVVPVLCLLLGQIGWHVVHAACLEAPAAGGRPRGLLIAGASGAGKTTASLALAGSGMRLLADDVCFVGGPPNQANQAPDVWGLLLACKVHIRTLEMLPFLRDLPRRPAVTDGEYIVDARRALGQGESRPVSPTAIFLLDDRNDRGHQLRLLEKTDALERLTRQNVRAPRPIFYGQAADAFRAIARLVSACRTYLLSVGPGMEELGERILAVVQE